jgi:hypothetical protein
MLNYNNNYSNYPNYNQGQQVQIGMGNYGINQKSNVVERYDYSNCPYTVDAITSTGTIPVCVDSETSQTKAGNGRLTAYYKDGDDYVGCTNNSVQNTNYYCTDKIYAFKHDNGILWRYNIWGKDTKFEIHTDQRNNLYIY